MSPFACKARLSLVALAATIATVAPASSAVSPGGTIRTVAGAGVGFAGDGGPATAAKLFFATGVARTPDGGFLIADNSNRRIRRVSPAGVITTVAGNGKSEFSGDGGPATAAALSSPSAVSPTGDGGFLVADTGNKRIRRVSAAGIMTTVAGCACATLGSGDGGPATAAFLNNPGDVAATPDGGFLIADTANWRIRKVSAAGIITTVAGNGRVGFSGDGGPATAAQLNVPEGVAPLPDGGFLIADSSNDRIRRVSPSGVITTVAGSATKGFSGDGGAATAAQLQHPKNVAAAPGGGFYISDSFNGRVRFVSTAGVISTVAGGGPATTSSGEGGPATSAHLSEPRGLAATPGGFLFADSSQSKILLVTAGGGSGAVKLSVSLSVPKACVKGAFTAAVRVSHGNPLASVAVYLDARRIATRTAASFTLSVKAGPLAKGRHAVRVQVVDRAGKRASVARTFTRCG